MKLKVLLSMLLAVFALAADEPQLKISMPKKEGKSGQSILLFHGGRPRDGNIAKDLLIKGGAKVTPVVGKYLAGLSGASIKQHLGDKVEPTPLDGITPAFKKLKDYPLVIFAFIKAENLQKLFTPERQALLKEYVANGGNVMFTVEMPAGILDEILPVTLGEKVITDINMKVDRPTGQRFEIFPTDIPYFRVYREAAAKPGAEVLSFIKDADGKVIAPFIVKGKFGKGSVTFFNTEKINPQQFRDFSNWAYCAAFWVATAAESGDLKMTPAKLIDTLEAIPERKEIADSTLTLAEPTFSVTDSNAAIEISDRTATFSDGAKVKVNANGAVEITLPGGEAPILRNFKIPAVAYSETKVTTGKLTYEADDLVDVVKAADIKWQFDRLTAENGVLNIHYRAKGSEMIWQFKSGKMDLDGREYVGVAERVKITQCPLFVNQINFESELCLPKPKFARRFSCYSPPRGYSDFPMDGSVKKSDTFTWNYFGSGQPFELIVCEDGVYLANVDTAFATTPRLIREKGKKYIQATRFHAVGRIKAPLETSFYWHWFSPGKERGHQEYLAMYQFIRQRYRRQNDLLELPPYPVVNFGYQLSREERQAVIDAAAKAGYRFIHPPMPENPIEKTNSPAAKGVYKLITDAGSSVHIWTAGSYVQGDGGWIINHHPEWFCKKEDGSIFSYGGNYPVIDVNNPEFYDWYCQVMTDAINSGVKWVYRDMDGAAARSINYAVPESPYGLKSQIRFYKFFHDHGARVSIEGMLPLVIDEYWYRADKYTSFAGNEFSLVGGLPSGDLRGGLTLDPFRTGMYGAFAAFEFSGTAFNFDRITGEVERGKRAATLAPKFNEALDFVGMPYVRETDFGTVWYGKGGAVMFFWDPVKKLTLDLPQGWKIRGVEGNVLTDIPGDSIIYIDRN